MLISMTHRWGKKEDDQEPNQSVHILGSRTARLGAKLTCLIDEHWRPFHPSTDQNLRTCDEIKCYGKNR